MHQNHIGLLQRRIRTACAHCNADIGSRQTWRIVHTVADHRDMFPLPAQFMDGLDFLLRLQLRAHVVEFQFGAQMFGGRHAVAGQND